MTTLAEIEWEPPVLAPTRDPALARYVQEAFGVIPPLAPYFYACPWIVRAAVAFDVAHVGIGHLDRQTVELIELVVSQDNSCRYCYAATRAVLKMHGLAEARIRQLESELLSAEVDPLLRAALNFARRVSHANPLPSQVDVAALRDCGLSSQAVKEVIFTAATTGFYNRLATLAAVPTDEVERLERSSLVRTAMGLVTWLRRLRRSRSPQPGPQCSRGPYTYLVDALSELALAPTLGRVLDDVWSSPALPRRTKAFLFAVVARGLGCHLSEREASKVLAGEGVDARTVETALAHLAADGLDAVEATAIPFARETIRYRPAQIQRRARAVSAQLRPDQFLEIVGIVSLANALCRMSLVLLPPS